VAKSILLSTCFSCVFSSAWHWYYVMLFLCFWSSVAEYFVFSFLVYHVWQKWFNHCYCHHR
jgi:hypothetical protein